MTVGMMEEVRLATDRQLGFLRALVARRAVAPAVERQIDLQLTLGMSARQASAFIDALLRLPVRPSFPPAPVEPVRGDLWPTVPEGRYAVADPADNVLKFYQVDKPQEGRWAGFTFLSVMASSERHPIRVHETKKAILDAIAADPREAAARYGQELGTCGVCGRALTDEESRARGIGPVCAGKRGWLSDGDSLPMVNQELAGDDAELASFTTTL